MQLKISSLSKHYTGVAALDGIDLDICSGELVALLAPSGSGKTTLLRVIAGLLQADAGRVQFGDIDATRLSLRERNVGFVFQHYALFRHMSVAENIAFGLRSRPRAKRPDKASITRRVQELLQLVQLPEHGGRYPDQLSGGQKQRVALARALAIDPSVLLLDEPFGALDAKVRVDLRRWLRTLHEQTGQTTLFVTHDQEEALELADRVVVMRQGRIEQVGSPDAIYNAPASPYVFDFIGRTNVLQGDVRDAGFRAGGLHLPAMGVVNGAAQLYVRPHDLVRTEAGAGTVTGRVLGVQRLGGRITSELQVEGQARALELESFDSGQGDALAVGDVVHLRPTRYRIFAGA